VWSEAGASRTLWLSEDTLLNAIADSSVEKRIEHGIDGGDFVVGLDILLEGSTAVKSQENANVNKRRVDFGILSSRHKVGTIRTLNHCAESQLLVRVVSNRGR
jgi:hypothetical protein